MSQMVQGVSQVQNLQPAFSGKKAEKAAKVDMSNPVDEVKISSKAKKGAKVGATIGVINSAFNICKGREVFKASISKNPIVAVAGTLTGIGISAGIFAGVGALAGKVADVISPNKEN